MSKTKANTNEKVNAPADGKFTENHQTVWQFIKFFIISTLAGVVEVVSFAILSKMLPAKFQADFDFFVFHYTKENELCLGAFIAFLVSAILAEIVSFIINRKATFDANNNVVASAIEYAVLVFVVISLKVWIGNALTPVISNITSIGLLVDWIPKLVSMGVAFAIIFPMNKFVIMKHKDTKEE